LVISNQNQNQPGHRCEDRAWSPRTHVIRWSETKIKTKTTPRKP